MRKAKVGDSVLFYGKTLQITELPVKNGVALAQVADPAIVEERKTLRAKVKKLRAVQAEETVKAKKLDPVQPRNTALWNKARKQIEAISAGFAGKYYHFRLRLDLLSFWKERGVWVSDGRILSDDQLDRFEELMGHRPMPGKGRTALLFLEAQEGGA